MSLNRDLLESLGLSEEEIGVILEARDMERSALEDEWDRRETALVAELEAMASEKGWKAKYEALKDEFDAFRLGVETDRERERKQQAYRRLLAEARVPERFHERIMKYTDFDAFEMEGDALRDEAAIMECLRREWGDFIAVDAVRGVPVDTPPEVASPAAMTAAQIMAIADDDRREREIARNHQMFGF